MPVLEKRSKQDTRQCAYCSAAAGRSVGRGISSSTRGVTASRRQGSPDERSGVATRVRGSNRYATCIPMATSIENRCSRSHSVAAVRSADQAESAIAVHSGLGGDARAMSRTKRRVNCSAQDFLAAWWRGDAGPVACGACTACCYYAGIPVDAKSDRRRLPHLLNRAERGWRTGAPAARGRGLHSPRGARLHHLRATARGLPQLRLPCLCCDGHCRALCPRPSAPGLGVCWSIAPASGGNRSEVELWQRDVSSDSGNVDDAFKDAAP